MTQTHTQKASAVALGVCICGTVFTALTTHGAVNITASRDYVDRKFATATNLIAMVGSEVEQTYTTVTNLENQKQDKLTPDQQYAVESGITSNKVSQYDGFISTNYLPLAGGMLSGSVEVVRSWSGKDEGYIAVSDPSGPYVWMSVWSNWVEVGISDGSTFTDYWDKDGLWLGPRYDNPSIKLLDPSRIYWGLGATTNGLCLSYDDNLQYTFPTNKSGVVAVEGDLTPEGVGALSASSNTLTSLGVVTEYLAQDQGDGAMVGGVRVRLSSLNHDNETSYQYNGVAVKRDGVNSDYLWDLNSINGVVRRQELGYYVNKSELTELVTAIVTNLMGNVYWNSSDGGQTIDAYYRDGAEVSNIVNQVNAYLRLENGHMSVYTDSSNVHATEDNGNDGNDGNESEE